MSLIEIRDLHKKYRENVVLNGVDMKIEKGDVIVIRYEGPKGGCLNQLEIPEKGSIVLDGREIDLSSGRNKKDILELRQKTGMVFQQFNLFERKTALQNVEEGLIVVRKKSREEARRLALEELDRVGMTAWANHYPRHLSGGQQQRVAIARALAMKPLLLLLDEPTSALDPEMVGEVLEVIRQLVREGFTMLLVSHEMAFVRNVSNRVIFIDNGVIVEDDKPQVVFHNPKNPRTREFLSKMHMLENTPEYFI